MCVCVFVIGMVHVHVEYYLYFIIPPILNLN